jgi:hypothetical protein
VVRERYDRPDEHRARQDYLQFVINDSPGFPQILSLHLLALLFAGHINTVRSAFKVRVGSDGSNMGRPILFFVCLFGFELAFACAAICGPPENWRGEF